MMVRVFPIACVLVAACMPEAVLGREMGPDPLKSLQYDLKEGNKIVEKAIYLLKSVRERPRLDSDVRDEFDKATVTVLKIDARNVMMVTGRTRYSPEYCVPGRLWKQRNLHVSKEEFWMKLWTAFFGTD